MFWLDLLGGFLCLSTGIYGSATLLGLVKKRYLVRKSFKARTKIYFLTRLRNLGNFPVSKPYHIFKTSVFSGHFCSPLLQCGLSQNFYAIHEASFPKYLNTKTQASELDCFECLNCSHFNAL